MGACVGDSPPRLLDLGSGAGIPGLVLAARWPGSRVALLEAARSRATALTAVIGRLGWTDRVRVVGERAELQGRIEGWRMGFPVVVARSFGPPAVTAECGGAFLELGGRLVVSDPPDAGERWPVSGLQEFGLLLERRCDAEGAHFAVLTRGAALAEEYPRRPGIPARRPRWR